MADRSLKKRACGVLLSVFSLPSRYGIGTMGIEAYRFVDFLESSGFAYWQVLPIGPTSYGDSPYQTFSTFAGNPYFIDLDFLAEDGLLAPKDISAADFGYDSKRINYEKLYATRFEVLRKAYKKYLDLSCDKTKKSKKINEITKEFKKFKKDEKSWLDDYALFMAIKVNSGSRSWNEWDEGLKFRRSVSIRSAREKYSSEIEFRKFIEYLFFKQWINLKSYANSKGIEIIGDIPIYVAYDSADTWSHRELFELDENASPTAVAGCPPDDYSKKGQLWGNPLYRWEAHKKDGYSWWISRFESAFRIFDIIRIDHFRGFESYYAIPYSDKTAERGVWKKGPDKELFEYMEKKLGVKKLIAEDLGFLTGRVRKMLKKTGYPGMKVLEFAFYESEKGGFNSEYLPHNYGRNHVVYTGTHDNDTLVSWFKSLNKNEKAFVRRYLGISSRKDLCSAMIRLAYSSTADTCIIPMQDILELDGSARVNTPSVLGGNWEWRMDKGALTDNISERLHRLAEDFGRGRG